MHIVIVDDQKTNREMFRYMLADLADDITLFENGEGVVDYLAELDRLPDIILMDVMMPVKDGFETAKEIRETFGGVHIPIIFLTVLDDRDSFGRCLFYGDDFILKPVGRSTLLAKVQAHYRIATMHNEVSRQRDELSHFREQVKYDYAISESIFTNLMEEMNHEIEGIQFVSTPTTVFNGDLIVMANRPQGGAYVMIADATGHGLPAAISSIPATRAFFSMTAKGLALGDIVSEINNSLGRFLPMGMMLAASLFEISANGRDVTWWGGGLPDGYVIGSDGQIINRLISRHMPLGVLSAEEFEADMTMLSMEEGQTILCYTDGVTEAANQYDEQFGEKRLKEVLRRGGDFIPAVSEAVSDFAGGPCHDDLSILTMRFPVINQNPECHELDKPFVSRIRSEARMVFDKAALGEANVMGEVRQFMTGMIAGGQDLDLICSVLSELLANAIEHGMLELDSGLKDDEDGFLVYYQQREERLRKLAEDARLELEISFEPVPGLCTMTVEHNGKGFDYEHMTAGDDDMSHGRGIVLVSALCESLNYSKEGKKVTAVYRLT